MSFARIFLISILFCIILSALAAFLMVQFLVGSFTNPTTSPSITGQSQNTSQK